MPAWTEERKARQSALIRSWKPWEQSTGPKTDEGKQEASRNRQRSLERARKEVANARKALSDAQDALERLGCKSTLDLAAIIALTKHF